MKNRISWICVLAALGILLATGVAVWGLKSKPDAAAVATVKTDLHVVKELKTRSSATSADAHGKYMKSGNSSEKIAMLNRTAKASADGKLLERVYKDLDDPSDDVRFAAAQLLDGFDANTAIPAISKALGDRNEEVRLVAIYALGESDVPEAAKLLVKCLGDDSEDVRRTVFSIAFTKDTATKEAILEGTVGSQYPDVKESLIDLAVDTPSHRTVDALLWILKDADEELKNGIFPVLEVFFSKEFKTYDDARNWWARNKYRFDDELVEK